VPRIFAHGELKEAREIVKRHHGVPLHVDGGQRLRPSRDKTEWAAWLGPA